MTIPTGQPARTVTLYAMLVPGLLLGWYLLRLGLYGWVISPVALRDPDTLMRLTLLRELQGTGWDAGYFQRLSPPQGVVFHWTKPFFAVVQALELAFTSFVSPVRALLYAGFFTGPVLSLFTAAACYWAGRPFLRPAVCALATAAICFSASFGVYFSFAVANHHSALILFFVVLLGCAVRLTGASQRLFILTGVICGLAVWESVETLPMVGALFAWAMLSSLWRRGLGYTDVLSLCTAAAATTAMGLLIDPPWGGYGAFVADRLSCPIFLLMVIPVAAWLPLSLFEAKSAELRMVLVAGLGAALLAGWYSWAAAQGALTTDPLVATEMLPGTPEMRPITDPATIVIALGNGLAGAIAWLWLGRHHRRFWPILIVLLALLGAGALHERFSVYSWIAGSYLIAWAVQTGMHSRLSFVGTMALCLLAALSVGGYQLTMAMMPDVQPRRASCSLPPVLPDLLRPEFLHLSPGEQPVFMTEFNDAPAVLYYTPFSTLGSAYHRDAAGAADAVLIFRATDDRVARNLMRDHDIRFVMVCGRKGQGAMGAPSFALYRKYRADPGYQWPATLYNRLAAGAAPSWMQAVPWSQGVASDLRLYAVGP